jgi:hypothetical protein
MYSRLCAGGKGMVGQPGGKRKSITIVLMAETPEKPDIPLAPE